MWHVKMRVQEKASPLLITFARDHCPNDIRMSRVILMTDSETQFYTANSNTPRISELKVPTTSSKLY